MRSLAFPMAVALFLAGCKSGGDGGDAGGQSVVPPAAAAMQAELATSMGRFVPLVSSVDATLVFVLNPGTPMAQGVAVQPDASAGVPPHTFTFGGPYDGNGDGLDETAMSGRVTFADDPGTAWSGMSGQVSLDVNIPVVGHAYHGEVAFSVGTAEKRLSGSGTFTPPLGGNRTTMSVAAATPLVVRPATGAAGAVANACGYSLEGQVALRVEGPTGTLATTWTFTPGSAAAVASGTSFTDPSGTSTSLPASTVELRCGSGGGPADWAATYDQNYACLPREWGQATLTVTATGPDSIAVVDEDPPGSGSSRTYAATAVAGNPHAMRGHFMGGPAGGQYREDFTWTLGKGLMGLYRPFTQVSSYTYVEGPNAGRSGICVASARRR